MSADFDALQKTFNDLWKRLDDNNALGIDVNGVRTRLFDAVSSEIEDVASDISATATDGAAHTRDLVIGMKCFPETLSEEIGSTPSNIQLDKLKDIASSVEMLLTSLQGAVKRPSTVFPRLVCGEIPVDPAKLINLQKRYARVQRLNAEDSGLKETDRSMPTAPKSGLDVITNVTSSLEGLADDVLVSAQSVSKLSEKFKQVQEKVKELKSSEEPVYELLEQQEAIQNLISQVSSAFRKEEGLSPASRDLDRKVPTNPLDVAENIGAKARSMQETGSALQNTIEKLTDAAKSFSSMASYVRELFSIARERLSNFVNSLKRLLANLPRITRELRQFFVPTGLKTLILRPSNALLSILQGVDDIKSCLSDTESITLSAIDKISEGDLGQKIDDIKLKVEEVQFLPRKLLSLLSNSDLHASIMKAIQLEMSNLLTEFTSTTIGETVTDVLQSVGAGSLLSEVGEQFTSMRPQDGPEGGISNGDSSKPGWGIALPWGADKLFS